MPKYTSIVLQIFKNLLNNFICHGICYLSNDILRPYCVDIGLVMNKLI